MASGTHYKFRNSTAVWSFMIALPCSCLLLL